jgi:hypothetical protein
LGGFFEDALQRLNALKALQLLIGAVSAIGYALVAPLDRTAVASQPRRV